MGLLDDCKEYFNTDNLYSLFDVQENVEESVLKKAYYKLSLKVHPDKAEYQQKETANRLFQIITNAYYILSDKEKRAVYDEQGIICDEDDHRDRNWESYWRMLFPKVTLMDIDDYLGKYKGSKEEYDDLKKWYEKFEGNFLMICNHIPGHTVKEEDRYKEILEKMIHDEEIPDYPAFHVKENKKNAAKRLKKAEREAKEAEATMKEMGLSDNSSDLRKAITERQGDRKNAFESLISSLESKYTKPKKPKKK